MPPTYGWDEVAFLTAQSALGTPVGPAAAKAVRMISADMGPAPARETRVAKDKALGRDETSVAYVRGQYKPTAWTLKASLIPSGVAGTAPQGWRELLISAGLTETVDPGVSVAYTQTGTPTPVGFTFSRGDRALTYAETLWGCVPQIIKVSVGGEEAMIEASGIAAGKDICGQSTVAVVTDGVVTTITLETAGHAYRFVAGSAALYAKIESECVKITAINYSTGALTVVRAQLGTSGAAHAAGSTIQPYFPTATYQAGVPISEALGSLSIDNGSNTIDILHASTTLKTGLDLRLEYGQTRAVRAIAKRISVESEFSCILDVADQHLLGNADQFVACNILVIAGTTAGNKFKWQLPFSEIMPSPTAFPEDEVVEAQIGVRSRGSVGNDTISMTYF